MSSDFKFLAKYISGFLVFSAILCAISYPIEMYVHKQKVKQTVLTIMETMEKHKETQ